MVKMCGDGVEIREKLEKLVLKRARRVIYVFSNNSGDCVEVERNSF